MSPRSLDSEVAFLGVEVSFQSHSMTSSINLCTGSTGTTSARDRESVSIIPTSHRNKPFNPFQTRKFPHPLVPTRVLPPPASVYPISITPLTVRPLWPAITRPPQHSLPLGRPPIKVPAPPPARTRIPFESIETHRRGITERQRVPPARPNLTYDSGRGVTGYVFLSKWPVFGSEVSCYRSCLPGY